MTCHDEGTVNQVMGDGIMALFGASLADEDHANCHLGLGKLHRRTGKRVAAQEHLTTATTMDREMDMHFWLEQAEAEIATLA